MKRLFVVLLLLAPLALAQTEKGTTLYGLPCDAVKGEVLLKFRAASHDKLTFGQYKKIIAGLEKQLDGKFHHVAGVKHLHSFKSRSKSVDELMIVFDHRDDIEFVEPNCAVGMAQQGTPVVPNDPYFPYQTITHGEQWGLHNSGTIGTAGVDIGAEVAWEYTTGSRANVIAVLDQEMDSANPDLAANLWSSTSSFTLTLSNGSHTCAAGTIGYDVGNFKCDSLTTLPQPYFHGMMTSGVIGAVGNNGKSVTGVNWTASILPIKINNTGTISWQMEVDGMEAARQLKVNYGVNVRVINFSITNGSFYSAAIDTELNALAAADILFVVGAGNSGYNMDITPAYPAAEAASFPNMISVAEINAYGVISTESNYGSMVQLAAPGEYTYSLCYTGSTQGLISHICDYNTPGYDYAWDHGTSMATPMVVGTAGLIMAACPSVTTYSQLKSTILNNVQADSNLTGLVSTGGYVRADYAVASCAPKPLVLNGKYKVSGSFKWGP